MIVLLSRLMLLHRENQFFQHVLKELIVFSPSSLRLLNPRVNREQSRLVELLRLHQSGDPVFLSLLQILNDVLLVHQVFLVFAKVLGAHIFNLVKLFIVFLLQVLSVSRRFVSSIGHEHFHVFGLCLDLRLQLFALIDQLLMELVAVLDTREFD